MVPGDPSFDDDFGWAVAAEGDTLLVGAPRHAGLAYSAGAAFVYERQGDDWLQTAKLLGADTAQGDSFGYSVALSGDTALIGAWNDDGGRGAAYVFERTGAGWAETAKLTAADGVSGDFFGGALALHGDRALVGAQYRTGTQTNQGAAYFFERAGGSWDQTAKLVATAPGAFDEFGAALDFDGTTAVVGAPRRTGQGFGAGGAYVFVETPAGWVQETLLTVVGPAQNHAFGTAIEVEGDRVAIGAPGSDAAAPGAGAVHVRSRFGPLWVEEAKLLAADAASYQFLGRSVALEGARLLAGAPGHSHAGPATGAAYVFENTGGTSWSQGAQLLAANAGDFDDLGTDVALSGDLLAVGAPAATFSEFGGGQQGAYLWSAGSVACPDLVGLPPALHLSTGGQQVLRVQPGPAFAGDLYLTLGSASGTSPGVSLGGFTLPLNPDPYLAFTLLNPGAPPLAIALGVLDSAGEGQTHFTLPPGLPGSLAGLVLHHAALVFELAGGSVVHATGDEPLLVLP